MRRLGLIGAGAMAETLLDALAEALPAPLDHLAILVTAKGRIRAETLLARLDPRVAQTTSAHETRASFLARAPDLVAECAGHAAVEEHAGAILQAGCPLILVSMGALADDDLRAGLERAARQGDTRLILPAGSIGGLDLLGAARLSGLASVRYTGRKPPSAWRGTRAELLLDLAALDGPATFFRGTAREAARLYPQNANVAAAVALAGMDFDATEVALVADPTIGENVHELHVSSACASFTLRIEGRPSPANPKTSRTAGFSLAHAILNHAAPTRIG
jgi:aspartate dehydrogenase